MVNPAILKEIGISVVETETRTESGSKALRAQVAAEGGVPFLAKAKGEAETSGSKTTEDAAEARFIEFDASSATDVIRVLQEVGFDLWIVLEDFHYLDPDVQRQLASDLKTFFERSKISFIIVGVWLKANRLVVYNGDLAGRITSIPADTWSPEELAAVVRAGEPLLNLKFSGAVVDELVARSQRNVGLLQEACRQVCINRNIFRTTKDLIDVDSLPEVTAAYEYVADQLAARYANVISTFSEGLRTRSSTCTSGSCIA